MKIRMTLLAISALALVAGCSRGAAPTNNATAGNMATNAAAPAAPANTTNSAVESAAPAEGGGGTVDVAFLTGRWGMNGDCSTTMEFRADGTASPPEGSTYTVEGNIVTVTDPGRPPDPRTVTRTGDDSMTVAGGNGPPMTLTRCR